MIHEVKKILAEFGVNNVKTLVDKKSFQQNMWKVEGDNEFYLRNYVGNFTWWNSNESNIQYREVEAYKLCRDHGLPVPKIFQSKEKWILFESISGKTGVEVDQRSILPQIARLLKCIHSIPMPSSKSDIERVDIPDIPLEKQQWVLNHGDFHNENMIFDESTLEIVGILDFEEAVWADPHWDLAYYCWYLIKHVLKDDLDENKSKIISEFLNAYGGWVQKTLVEVSALIELRNRRANIFAQYHKMDDKFSSFDTNFTSWLKYLKFTP